MAKNGVGRLTKAQELERDKKLLEEEKFALKWQKHMANIEDLKKHIQKLEEENRELRLQNEEYKANVFLNQNDDDTTKKILSYYAKGNTYKSIYDKMLFHGFNGDIEHIKYICQNVESLESVFLLYYKEQVEAHEKNIKINPDLINNTLISVLEQNINDATQDLNAITDVKEKCNLRQEITKHAKELTNLMKNIADIKDDIKQNEALSRIATNLNKTYDDESQSNYVSIDMEDMVVM